MKINWLDEVEFAEYLQNNGIIDFRKYVNFTREYFPNILKNKELCNIFYIKFVDRILEKNDILYRVYVNEEKKIDVANSMNKSESFIYSYFDRHKENTRNRYNDLYSKYSNYDFDSVKTYLEFSEMFFDDLLENPDNFTTLYKDFVDRKINSDALLSKLFVNDLSEKEACEELNMSENTYNNKVYKMKSKMKEKYKVLSKYKDSTVNEALMYISFTEYYFPHLKDKDIVVDSKYLNFVKKVVGDDELLTLHFKDGVSLAKIGERKNKSIKQISLLLSKKKDNLYKLYKEMVLNKKY